ncbi:unnamed protein product [Ilex paraguariensis]|uniref:Uncharacterized protein n=1 Tax=Ilex paraguariensis TaxID=185542 RepID=A0ABC8UPH4_9AQUA
MDSDRPHRTTSTSSELFICFTSRLSSSSMKISSKSILSPGRARDPPISLSTSLSRRLRTNGSIKGGQASPMFPTGGKKRGCAFENPEPSSPKVTCIGQVRVKTKKTVKQTRSLSKRRSGEVSFRKIEQNVSQNEDQIRSQVYQQINRSSHSQFQQQSHECLPHHRNQRWVHLPLTICEALRAFGAEFSCLFPCRPSCFSTNERDKEEKAMASSEGSGQNSCGAVFARWLVALQDGEGGKGREIELVVGGDEERTEVTERPRSSRRHVFDDIEIKDDKIEVTDEVLGEEEARVSICIPPKNALLLMRCRSDPTRVAALTNRFWESPRPKDEEDEREGNEENKDEEDKVHVEECEAKDLANLEQEECEVSEKSVPVEVEEEQGKPEAETEMGMEVQDIAEEKLQINGGLQDTEQSKQEEEEMEVNQTLVEEENEIAGSSSEAIVDLENAENEEDDSVPVMEEVSRASYPSSSVQSDEEQEAEPKELEAAALAEDSEPEEEERSLADESTLEKETQENYLDKEEETTMSQERDEAEEDETQDTHEPEEEDKQEGTESEESESESHKTQLVERESHQAKKQQRESSVLPDCLLLMMCEPKLSMEVSKETWVCSTDFIRWQPTEKKSQVNPKDGPDESKKRVSSESNISSNPALSVHCNQPLQQPPRSSCSFPAPAATSMATMIEQKLLNAAAYEPFVLTRCKSEPMRTAAKLAPEACFWKNRKLEPHRRATCGVGAAGVGF